MILEKARVKSSWCPELPTNQRPLVASTHQKFQSKKRKQSGSNNDILQLTFQSTSIDPSPSPGSLQRHQNMLRRLSRGNPLLLAPSKPSFPHRIQKVCCPEIIISIHHQNFLTGHRGHSIILQEDALMNPQRRH